MQRDEMIAGRYRLVERVGAGGQGEVWRATDDELGREVALKRSQQGDDGQIRREARVGAGLNHPHVVTVHDVVQHGDERWLVMEYLPSRNLSAVLAEDGPFSPEAAALVGAQVASALVAMHERGMVHRDIKPGNVLYTAEGHAKLTDLGIARWAEVTRTSSGQIGGTPGFVAPEVADGEEAGPPADVFSLGATLFALVEGHSPWGTGESGPYAQLRRAAAGDREPLERAGALAPVLERLLATDPQERPTARQAKGLLDEVSGETVPIVPLPKPRGVRRRWWLVGGAVAATVVLAGGATIYWVGNSPVKGSIGDERTADLCALLNADAVARFGPPAMLDPLYGDFNQCALNIQMGGNDKDIVVNTVRVDRPGEDPTRPPTPGTISPVEYPVSKDPNLCARPFWSADAKRVTIEARQKSPDKGFPKPDLCAIADAMAGTTVQILAQGVLPRRGPVDPDSLANLDACTLLRQEDFQRVVGLGNLPEDAQFGNWLCWWEKDWPGQGPEVEDKQAVELEVRFQRSWYRKPGDVDKEDGEVEVKVGDRYAVLDAGGDPAVHGRGCSATLDFRRFQQRAGWNGDWLEQVYVVVETDRHKDEELCAMAEKLIRLVNDRLPE
ncbi:hypothetical protein JOF53_000093 [Crossiella equi]|uniref:non-specific serine/threonine protein kinase n=1 Tax=Crossiella equi TaxID=130796 RepID=A0ABS5A3U9_9PSEU|nr:serine/threonine-protein kinase [Crossiella equi]MBP2471221.1 hypothetical protein [Crossiella equi]